MHPRSVRQHRSGSAPGRDDFVTLAGHELRTPLAAVQLQLEGLARLARTRRPGFEAAVDERLSRSLEHLDRLQALVTRLLEVAHLAGSPLELAAEPIDFAETVRVAVGRLQGPASRAGSPISLRAGEQLWGTFDRRRLDELATHLVSNAVKFGLGRPIEVDLRRDAGSACLTVRDRGIGIHRQDSLRIFERFARAAPPTQYGGLGLGLWIVRRIVDAAGGTVEVESAPGRGATFTVRLPLGTPPGPRP